MGSQLCPTMVIKGHFLLLLMAFTVRGEMISLSPADADTKIAAGYFDIIVDVRNCQEFDQGHISGALNLKGTSAVQQLAGCEDKKIGVYCWTGPDRATPAATALADAGFLEVSDVGGLQFLSTPTVQGRWDTALPSCAAGKSGATTTISRSGACDYPLLIECSQALMTALYATSFSQLVV